MHTARRDAATPPDSDPAPQDEPTERQDAAGSEANHHTPGMIVVGSTTTALLVEAMAMAGMLSGHAEIGRAATWAVAAEQSGRYAPCLAIVSQPEGTGAPRLRDARGNAVEIVDAEAVLARCRETDARPDRARGMGTAVRAAIQHERSHLEHLAQRLQPAVLTRLARR